MVKVIVSPNMYPHHPPIVSLSDHSVGNYQYDVYRWMRQLVKEGSDWKGFYPKTNVYWVQYLVHQLSYGVDRIDHSISRHNRLYKRQFREFLNRVLQAERLEELLDDPFFSEVLESRNHHPR